MTQDKPRKGWTKLSDTEWRRIQASYENDPDRPTLDSLAAVYGIDSSTVCKRAKTQSWTRNDSLAIRTINRIKEENNAIVEQTTANVAQQLSQHLTDSLQPWIEREKARHLKNQVKRSKLALTQLDQHIDKEIKLSPKDSSFIAKTAETWDNIMRRTLGMNDSVPAGTSLTLNVLTNDAAVQVKSSPNEK